MNLNVTDVHVNGGPQRWKIIGFPILAILFTLFGFFFLEGATEALEPWQPSDCEGCSAETAVPDSYRWLATSHGGLLAFLFGGSLIALLRRPFEKPMLLHFYAAGHLIFLAALAATAPALALEKAFIFVLFLLTLTILFAFYHNRSSAIRLDPPGKYSRPLLALTAIAAIFLLPVAINAGIQQWSETAGQFRWGEHTAMVLTLLYGGVLTASRRAGSSALGLIVSLTYLYLGASALAVPEHPGSWGIAGGTASLLYGAIFAAATIFGNRPR
ncbi:hypothetical protein B0G52_115182 [Cohnella sp. SGD-V74]|uniref:hypothetical protein n=1 Tax=unclassified Cohnella TaxID=2636738 RepID=UPI000D43B0D3|nr:MULTISPECIES: hypothetical protein [unclassified Cohnella]PRX67172.1 hypothetical protein B0G52_115182 [Cohnella sp. SGD-V74]